MSNYASINLVKELARLPGVGNVTVFGAGQYAMRVWMDPQKIYALGLVPQDIVNVISLQSQQVTAGRSVYRRRLRRRISNTPSTSRDA
jgi:HAE1 family hydrophobic/amphiphilic exporter-1